MFPYASRCFQMYPDAPKMIPKCFLMLPKMLPRCLRMPPPDASQMLPKCSQVPPRCAPARHHPAEHIISFSRSRLCVDLTVAILAQVSCHCPFSSSKASDDYALSLHGGHFSPINTRLLSLWHAPLASTSLYSGAGCVTSSTVIGCGGNRWLVEENSPRPWKFGGKSSSISMAGTSPPRTRSQIQFDIEGISNPGLAALELHPAMPKLSLRQKSFHFICYGRPPGLVLF